MPRRMNPESGRGYCFKNRVGTRIGRLLFVRHVGVDKNLHHVWEAKCDCGRITQTSRPHKTKSCGCLQREAAAATQRKKALPHGEKRRRVLENRKRQHARRQSDPLRAMQARISRLYRHALVRIGSIKTSPTFERLGYSVEEFVVHIEKQFHNGMGWHNMDRWQIDHIVPVSTASTLDDVVALNQLSNLRPMWAKQNNAKKGRRENLL